MLTSTVGMSDFAISVITASVPGIERMKPSKPSPFSSTSSRFVKNLPGLVVCRRQFRLLDISYRVPAKVSRPLHGARSYTAMTL